MGASYVPGRRLNAELAGQVALVGKEYVYDDREAVDCHLVL